MRVPFLLTIGVISLIAFKALILGPIVLTLLIIAMVVAGFVGAIVFGLKIIFYCASRLNHQTPPVAPVRQPAPPPTPVAPTPSPPPVPPMARRIYRQPGHKDYASTRSYHKDLYGVRRTQPGMSWGWLGLGVVVLIILGLEMRNKFDRGPYTAEEDHSSKRTEDRGSRRASVVPKDSKAQTSKISKPIETAPIWKSKAVGVGDTEGQATTMATESSRDQVVDFLLEQSPPVKWAPPLAYVRKKLIKGDPVNVELKPEEKSPGVNRRVELAVEVGPREMAEMLEFARQYGVDDRIATLGKALAGLIAVLVAVMGYIRLDDWSKGYYTGWLRLAAAGFVAAVGAGLWLISPY